MTGEKSILVTGASGFIGSELCKALLERGYEVTALMRSENGLAVTGVRCVVQDLEARLDEGFLEERFDAVVHLAGKAHGKGGPGEQTPEAFEKSNVGPTKRLAEAAAAMGVNHFIFLSSIGVHGDSTQGSPINEESPERPHADYAQSKLQAERVLRETLADTATTYSIIRPTLVYGQSAPGNFGKLVRIAPLPLGCAENQRSLVSVDSLVRLIILCIERPEAKNQMFVAADEKPVSTSDIVRCLRSGMGKRPGLIPVPAVLFQALLAGTGKASRYQQLFGNLEVDATKAVETLGWEREAETMNLLRSIGEKAVEC
jgi:nucleoside-diphosphate-sugar epimerase